MPATLEVVSPNVVVSKDLSSVKGPEKDNINVRPIPTKDERYILFSPYDDHFLDLDRETTQNRLFARALCILDNSRADYPTAPYPDSFNYGAVVDTLRHLVQTEKQTWHRDHFYVIAFRSRIPPSTNYGDLGSLDKDAHQEANESGGLLKYWFNDPDVNGRNLATCVWLTPGHAQRAGVLPLHRKAAGSVRSMYTEWRIERLRLQIEDNVESWSLTDWTD